MFLINPIKLLLSATLISAVLFVPVFAAEPLPTDNTADTTSPDPAKLVGRWQRPDGGYVLQLTDPEADGRLTAAYFNPRPVHVSQAVWKHMNGYLGMFVELRAPNYPGSTYTLVYNADRDQLVGLYYQATMGQKFNVEFKRIP